MFDKSM